MSYIDEGTEWLCFFSAGNLYTMGRTYEVITDPDYPDGFLESDCGSEHILLPSGVATYEFIPLSACDQKLLFKARISGNYEELALESYNWLGCNDL